MLKISKKWKIVIIGLAVLTIGVLVWISQAEKLGEEIPLSDASSKDVTVHYTEHPVIEMADVDPDYLSEEDVFSDAEFANSIVRGTVKELKHIVCDLNGYKVYCARIEIDVEKTYRGDDESGKTISVLLPYDWKVYGNGYSTLETLTPVKEGMEGIFILGRNDENSVWKRERTGLVLKDSVWQRSYTTLALTDVAQYRMANGNSWMFLQKSRTTLYYEGPYHGIEGKNLDAAEQYILEMIKKVQLK